MKNQLYIYIVVQSEQTHIIHAPKQKKKKYDIFNISKIKNKQQKFNNH